jgi:hypothetical protein
MRIRQQAEWFYLNTEATSDPEDGGSTFIRNVGEAPTSLCFFLADCLFSLLICPKDGGGRFLRNVGEASTSLCFLLADCLAYFPAL